MDCKTHYWYADYECSTYVSKKRRKCSYHGIRQDDLNAKVLNAIKTQVKVAMDYDVLLAKLRNSEADKSVRDQINNAILSIQQRMRGLQQKRTKLYEDYVEGILDESEYAFAKKTYDDQYDVFNRQLDELVVRRSEYQEALSSDNKWITLMKSIRNTKTLTQKLVDACIERVEVCDDKSINLMMKYHDIYELTVKYANEIKKEAEKNG